MLVEEKLPLVDEILGNWKTVIGKNYEGYKNHVYRMIHFCFAIKDCNSDERQKVIIAACFHDLGLFTENTVDYLPPSIVLAKKSYAAFSLNSLNTPQTGYDSERQQDSSLSMSSGKIIFFDPGQDFKFFI